MMWRPGALSAWLAVSVAAPLAGQVQIRLADSTRATYS